MEQGTELIWTEPFEPGDGLAPEIVSCWKLYELINPSDPYTFYAPNMRTAWAATRQLGTAYGCKDTGTGGSSPLLFGLMPYVEQQGINRDFLEANAGTLARVFDSFCISTPQRRKLFNQVLGHVTSSCGNSAARHAYRTQYNDENRSSLNDIGALARSIAKICADYAEGGSDARSPWTTG